VRLVKTGLSTSHPGPSNSPLSVLLNLAINQSNSLVLASPRLSQKCRLNAARPRRRPIQFSLPAVPRFQIAAAQAAAAAADVANADVPTAAAAPAADSSSTAADAAEPVGSEFTDPRRLEILTELRGVMANWECKWSTAWACFWLAGLSCLEEFLRRAKNEPGWAACFLELVDGAAVIKACKSSHLFFALPNRKQG
jgi:hypothetical protein